MALVRRSGVLGQPAGQVVAAAVGAAPVPAIGYAQVPRAGGQDGEYAPAGPGIAAPPGAPVSAPPGVPPGGVAAVAGIGPAAAAPGGDAAAAASMPANTMAVLGGFGFAGLGLLAAFAFKATGHEAPAFQIGNQMSTFGALFVFAAAVERVLEPVSHWLPGRRTKADFEQTVAAMANRDPRVSLAHVAAAKARMDRARSNRTVLVWGLATGFATVLSAWGGFYLLHMLSANPNWDLVPGWVDALVTGLVVGSGTKPLHDVINRVQQTKEKAEDPTR
jgi:hypothetical protein